MRADVASPLDPAAMPLAWIDDEALAIVPVDVEPRPCGVDAPCIRNLRVIQFDYSALGGTLVCSWQIVDGPFEEIIVYVDQIPQKRLPGDTEGVNLGFRRIGRHVIHVEGIRKELTVTERAEFTVLAESPLAPIEITRWISYGFQPRELGGSIEVQWKAMEDGPDPIIEVEIFVNGTFQGTLPIERGSVTFSKLDPGPYRVRLRALSRFHTSGTMAETSCVAQPVAAPFASRCELIGCENGRGTFRVEYRRPATETYDFIAVWIADESDIIDPVDGPDAPDILLDWKFRGFFRPQGRANDIDAIVLENLPAPRVALELAGARFFDDNLREPILFSNIPRGEGEHVRLSCITDPRKCENGTEPFRRGDANLDGFLDIGDAVRSLFTLFLGGFEQFCPDSMDSDDNGRLEITDPIYILNYLFLGINGPPPDPGPRRCGPDPTPDGLPPCVRSGCPEILPADPR